jgi:hypothetical protein
LGLRGSIVNDWNARLAWHEGAARSDGQAIGIMVKLKEKNEGASALVLRVLAPQNKSV